MKNCCKCACGNLSVHGEFLRHKDLPRALRSRKAAEYNVGKRILRINKKSVHIHSLEQTEIRNINGEKATVICRRCGRSIEIIEEHNTGFAYFNDKQNVHFRRSSDPTTSKHPEVRNAVFPIYKYLSIENENELTHNRFSFELEENTENTNQPEIEFFDDGDFDLMFSGDIEPFVGSFTDNFLSLSSVEVFV